MINHRLRKELGDDLYIGYLEACIKHREEQIDNLSKIIEKACRKGLNEERRRETKEVIRLNFRKDG